MDHDEPLHDHLDERHVHYVDVDGIRTRYYEAGQGDPLVLIHGGQFGSIYSLDSWSLNLEPLARHFRVIALDKLGQGYTGNPRTAADYTFEAVLNHAAGLLDALQVRRAHVAGHSRGALVAAQLAFRRPDLVKSVIVVDSSTLSRAEEGQVSYKFYEDIARQAPLGPATLEYALMEPRAQAFSTRNITEDFARRLLAIGQLPSYVEAQARLREGALRGFLPNLDQYREDAIDRIERDGFATPALVIWGFNDIPAPLALGHRLFERICARTPHAEMHVLNQSGHYSFREQYAGFNRAVTAFCLRASAESD
jgi:2-hydroxy-6-oxo-6-(2'-carboxyphenyl)-hexa-2,4-dienoate hydrolase